MTEQRVQRLVLMFLVCAMALMALPLVSAAHAPSPSAPGSRFERSTPQLPDWPRYRFNPAA